MNTPSDKMIIEDEINVPKKSSEVDEGCVRRMIIKNVARKKANILPVARLRVAGFVLLTWDSLNI